MWHDFYSGSNLLVWPLLGLGLFLLSFAAVLFYAAVGLRDRATLERLSSLPLDPGEETLVTDAVPHCEGKVN